MPKLLHDLPGRPRRHLSNLVRHLAAQGSLRPDVVKRRMKLLTFGLIITLAIWGAGLADWSVWALVALTAITGFQLWTHAALFRLLRLRPADRTHADVYLRLITKSRDSGPPIRPLAHATLVASVVGAAGWVSSWPWAFLLMGVLASFACGFPLLMVRRRAPARCWPFDGARLGLIMYVGFVGLIATSAFVRAVTDEGASLRTALDILRPTDLVSQRGTLFWSLITLTLAGLCTEYLGRPAPEKERTIRSVRKVDPPRNETPFT